MQQAAFEVIGGKRLSGNIEVQGAKNEALEIISAVLLTDQPVTISNIPNILDVMHLIEILESIGVKTTRQTADTFVFQADNIDLDYLHSEAFKKQTGKLRGSAMILGPLLGRFKMAFLPRPGGDKIGRRRLDTHFLGLQALGAVFTYDDQTGAFNISTASKQGLVGAYILLEEASVTGTANVLMAAVLAQGLTTIFNAACEPYIQQLCKMLNLMGAKISGIGSNLLHIEGVQKLNGCQHRILPDMLEIGSFIGMAAITQSDIIIKNAYPHEFIPAINPFKKLGIEINFSGNDIHVPAQDSYEIQKFIDGSILTIYDHPWPGVNPDLLSILLVTATQAHGSVLIHQKMFESRLFFTDKLIDMGAQIILCDPHRAVISNIDQIDRGYQQIDTRLQAIGAEIRRL